MDIPFRLTMLIALTALVSGCVHKGKEEHINKPVVPAYTHLKQKPKKIYLPPPLSLDKIVKPYKKFPILESKKISLHAPNAPLRTVLFLVAKDLGLNLIIDKDVDDRQKISVNFNQTPAKEALDIISDLANIYYEIRGNVLIVKATKTEILQFPYIKATSNYNASLGGDVLGSVSMGGSITGGLGGRYGGNNLQGNYSLQFQGQARDFYEELEKNIKSLLSEKGKLSIDRNTGTIVITDRVKNIKLVKKFLKKLKNELKKQVLIEAKIVEVSLNNSWKFGIDWQTLLSNTLGASSIQLSQSLAIPEANAQVLVLSDSFRAVLNALAQAGNVETLSNPRILALNGQPALISTGTIVPFWEKQVQTITTQTTTTTENYVKNNVLNGILLGVQPYINSDGTITMNIIPVATSLKGTKQLIVGNKVQAEAPIIELKEAGTVIKVKDGQLVVIGGLMSKSKSNVEKKVPFLGDIPVLGNLFKQKEQVVEKKELIIFLKPKIVR